MVIPAEFRRARAQQLSPSRAESALMRAARQGRPSAIRFFVRNGAAVDARDAMGRTALHVAAEHGHVQAVRALLELGAAPNARDRLGATPIDWARANGHARAANAMRFAGGHRARGEAPRRYLAFAAG